MENKTAKFIARLKELLRDKTEQNRILLETLDRKDATIAALEDELASSGDARYAKQAERFKRMEQEISRLRAELRNKLNA